MSLPRLYLVSLAVALLVICFSLTACTSDDDDDAAAGDDDDDDDNDDNDDDDTPGEYVFPDDFLFGVSTSSFQCDMGCPTLGDECVDRNSDWYQYVTNQNTVALARTYLVGDDPAVVGPGMWELYEQDFDRARDELQLGAFRIGIDWSRIFPTSTEGIEGHDDLLAVADPDAVAHYHAVFAALKTRGLKPLVTIHHYVLPSWIHDGVGCTLNLNSCEPRGWLDPERTVAEIAKFAGFLAAEYGGEVDLWTTLNEPFAVLLPGFLLPTESRTNPPAQLLRAGPFKTAFAAMVYAHARMVDAVRAGDTIDADGDDVPAEVGIVYAMAPVRPMDPASDLDRQAAENVFYLWNLAFLDAVTLGMFDAALDGHQQYRPELAGRMDFVGVNYYVRLAVEGLPFSLLPWMSPLATFNPITMIMDESYPRGIYELTKLIDERYNVPVIITENNGQVTCFGEYAEETRRLVEHVSWVWRAWNEGVDLRGYFYWSLMDNYEWNAGSTLGFGLYGVDPADPTKTRVARPMVPVYADIAGHLAISDELRAQYPIDTSE